MPGTEKSQTQSVITNRADATLQTAINNSSFSRIEQMNSALLLLLEPLQTQAASVGFSASVVNKFLGDTSFLVMFLVHR